MEDTQAIRAALDMAQKKLPAAVRRLDFKMGADHLGEESIFVTASIYEPENYRKLPVEIFEIVHDALRHLSPFYFPYIRFRAVRARPKQKAGRSRK